MRVLGRVSLMMWMVCCLALSACDEESGGEDAGPPAADSGPGGADAEPDGADAGDDAGDDAGPPEVDAGPIAGEWAVLVRGALADEPSVIGPQHDALAAGGEAPAMMLGDFAHDVHLGTTLLGTTENQFIGVDRWTSLSGLMSFYADPDFMMGFAALFSGPPSVETFARADGWHEWGSLDAADDTDPHYWVVVRGHLADDPSVVQPMHDALAAGGEAPAMAAGDIGHVVYLGVEDDREFLAFDVWTSDAGIEAFYGNPDFMSGFAMLFDAPASVTVHRSTDWHQW